MANDGPSARIGVLVEFNYEDLEVLYLGFQATVVKQDPWYPAPPPLLLPPTHTHTGVVSTATVQGGGDGNIHYWPRGGESVPIQEGLPLQGRPRH